MINSKGRNNLLSASLSCPTSPISVVKNDNELRKSSDLIQDDLNIGRVNRSSKDNLLALSGERTNNFIKSIDVEKENIKPNFQVPSSPIIRLDEIKRRLNVSLDIIVPDNLVENENESKEVLFLRRLGTVFNEVSLGRKYVEPHQIPTILAEVFPTKFLPFISESIQVWLKQYYVNQYAQMGLEGIVTQEFGHYRNLDKPLEYEMGISVNQVAEIAADVFERGINVLTSST